VASPSVIVVGAGIVGCTVAYELAKAGARVRVIETRSPGQGATRASAGILAPFIEGHEDIFRELGARSLELYDSFIARLRADSGHAIVYERTGTCEFAFSDADVTRLQAAAAAASKQGVESRWLRPDECRDVEPHGATNSLGALLIPTHGFVGVTSLTLAAAAAAERLGATFINANGAIRIFPLAPDRVGVTTATATWDADKVILAAGSWSSQIAVDGVTAVPVKPIRGQLIQLQFEPGMLRRVLWGPDGYLVPWPDGSVLIGSTVEDVGFDERHTDAAVERLRTVAATLVPALASRPVAGIRTGLRPRGPDDLPILGPSQVIPGLIYATAHYRNGVMFAPLTTELVRDLAFDRASDPALQYFQPGRHGSL
jgi:glycine oxidase